MVWSRFKVFWFSKDHLTGHSERKDGQTRQKKGWEDNIKEWTGTVQAQIAWLKTGQYGKGFLRTHLVPRRPSKVMGLNRTMFVVFLSSWYRELLLDCNHKAKMAKY